MADGLGKLAASGNGRERGVEEDAGLHRFDAEWLSKRPDCDHHPVRQRWALPPQFAAREPRALPQRRKLRPGNLLMDAPAEATIGAGDDVLAADELCKANDPVRNQTRMLDHVGCVADHA